MSLAAGIGYYHSVGWCQVVLIPYGLLNALYVQIATHRSTGAALTVFVKPSHNPHVLIAVCGFTLKHDYVTNFEFFQFVLLSERLPYRRRYVIRRSDYGTHIKYTPIYLMKIKYPIYCWV